jgi:hypothetical protein
MHRNVSILVLESSQQALTFGFDTLDKLELPFVG